MRLSRIGFGAVLNDTPQMSVSPNYGELVELCLRCEEAGFASAWLMDHLTWGPQSSVLECWTTLTALICDTSRIHFGPFFLCNSYRNPALVAKMAATLDVISKGRLELGMGAGWKEDEYRAYGYSFGSASERIRRLDEAVTIMRMMWTGEPVTFRGEYYNVSEAICRPVPIQPSGPRLWIGGGGEQLTLRVAAKHANACNFSGLSTSLETFEKKSAVLERHCRSVGRDPGELVKSVTLGLVLGRNDDEAHEREARVPPTKSTTRFVGTPSHCIDYLESYVDAGVSYFMLLVEDLLPGLDLLAEQVLPSFL
jgi:F420-dependent oxidoreductase-like protein